MSELRHCRSACFYEKVADSSESVSGSVSVSTVKMTVLSRFRSR
ncbi:hypothetical protein D3OALGA1CA_4288 [Olavius algarvensis associated proteobacterium Delta 3]|nr:hypothetical protein D3OALGB2SA_97 [Olavius algarvensis associated proteobacterium Delta 3]CAB5148570.1 hypothetical protein D3OALGA1CA_4288 [Olavius algarvensis associated proteobacterium Delta 3]